MLKTKNSNQYLVCITGVSFYLISLAIHYHLDKPKLNISKQDSALNINRDLLKTWSIGNKRLISSWLWTQTLLEADTERYSKKDKNNWLYHRFKTISVLEPDFYENYYYGGMLLSIIKDDLIGAAEIYELGLEKFPNDYSLSFNAGFNYYFEMNEYEKGLKILNNIKDHPKTPIILKSIINKLDFEVNRDYETSFAFILHAIDNTSDEYIKNKLIKDAYSLKATKDLECLNSQENNCDKKDFFGNYYLKKNNTWTAANQFKKYKISMPPHKINDEKNRGKD